MFDPPVAAIPFLALYAETHFRFFRFFPSLLYRNRPEIVFDIPARITPHADLPVMLAINDIDRFPVELVQVSIAVSCGSRQPLMHSFENPQLHLVPHPLQKQCHIYLFTIPRPALPDGRIYVNGKASIKIHGRIEHILNDNFPGSSKTPLACYSAEFELPGHERCSYGDLHVHTQFSQSHVEFGPPVPVISRMAEAYGIDFLGITDHSYDLCCSIDDYLSRDETLNRWKLLNEQISDQQGGNVFILPGEEVSCLNGRGKVVHLCAIGISKYIAGSLDGARKGRKKEKQLTITGVIKDIHQQKACAVAAHPCSGHGLLQRFFLNRGTWNEKDIPEDLDGFQAVNDGFSDSWKRSKTLWIKKLMKGYKLPLIAGNDSHGDFSRFRAVGTPFLSIHENSQRYMAYARTGIYEKAASIEQIINVLRSGATFITTGPFLDIAMSESPSQSIVKNEDTPISLDDSISVTAESIPESGSIRNLALFHYVYGTQSEKIILKKHYPGTQLKVIETIAVTLLSGRGYLRAELSCITDDGFVAHAATSPCYYVTYRRKDKRYEAKYA